MKSVKNNCPLCGGSACLTLGREGQYPMYNRYVCKTFDRTFSVGNTTLNCDDGTLTEKLKEVFDKQLSSISESQIEHLRFFFEPSYKVTEEEKRLGFVNLAEL